MAKDVSVKWAVGILSTLLCASFIAGASAAWNRATTNANSIKEHSELETHPPMKVRADSIDLSLSRIERRQERQDDKLDGIKDLIIERLPDPPGR